MNRNTACILFTLSFLSYPRMRLNNGINTIGKNIAGKKFITLIFVNSNRFNPKATNNNEPTADIAYTMDSLKYGATNLARSIIPPSYKRIANADNITPAPFVVVKIIEANPSIKAFVIKIP